MCRLFVIYTILAQSALRWFEHFCVEQKWTWHSCQMTNIMCGWVIMINNFKHYLSTIDLNLSANRWCISTSSHPFSHLSDFCFASKAVQKLASKGIKKLTIVLTHKNELAFIFSWYTYLIFVIGGARAKKFCHDPYVKIYWMWKIASFWGEFGCFFFNSFWGLKILPV